MDHDHIYVVRREKGRWNYDHDGPSWMRYVVKKMTYLDEERNRYHWKDVVIKEFPKLKANDKARGVKLDIQCAEAHALAAKLNAERC